MRSEYREAKDGECYLGVWCMAYLYNIVYADRRSSIIFIPSSVGLKNNP